MDESVSKGRNADDTQRYSRRTEPVLKVHARQKRKGRNADGYSTKVFLGDPAHVRMRQTEPLQTRLDSVQSLIDERGAVEH